VNTQKLHISVKENPEYTLWNIEGSADLESWTRIIRKTPPAQSPRLLIDFSRSTSIHVNSEDIRMIVSEAMLRKPDIQPEKTAMIVSETLSYGFGRMYSTLSQIQGHHIRFEVFTDPNEALHWLTDNNT